MNNKLVEFLEEAFKFFGKFYVVDMSYMKILICDFKCDLLVASLNFAHLQNIYMVFDAFEVIIVHYQ